MSLATGRRRAGEARASALDRLLLLGRLSYKRQLFILLLPYLLGLFGLVVLPALLSIPFAFTDYDALSPPEWIGLGNFREMSGDWLFWNGLSASLFFIAIAVPLRVLGAVLLAFLLQKSTRVNKFIRGIVYLPTIVPDVAYALLWLYIFNPLYGPLNWVLGALGIFPGAWLLFPLPAKFAIVIMMLFPIGEGFVLMLAAHQDIPGELQEAAAADGATGWQRFWHITMPLLAPAILLLLFRDTVLSFQSNFVPGLITTEGGPYHATEFLPIYIWTNASEYQRFGYASAMTWVMYAITAIVILLQFLVARRWRNALYEQ
ncbi:MAG: sugar ABC transporter permease [Chloroflexota bacterium]|nr:sugar ABC transporter permease [Chloroflexota bacterium]